MEKTKNSSVWIEVGYNIFAEEGVRGIQIERLARILSLNKSGFYHYFGDLEGFCEELIRVHENKAVFYLADLGRIRSIDPDYLNLLVKYKTEVMFHLQLIRSKNNLLFYETAEKIDGQEEAILRDMWSDYLGIRDNPSLAIRYFSLVRDMLYTRLSLKNLEYPFLHKLVAEARAVVQQMTVTTEFVTGESIT